MNWLSKEWQRRDELIAGIIDAYSDEPQGPSAKQIGDAVTFRTGVKTDGRSVRRVCRRRRLPLPKRDVLRFGRGQRSIKQIIPSAKLALELDAFLSGELSVEEAAKHLGCSRSSVYKFAKKRAG